MAEMEYLGECKISLEIELPKQFIVYVVITIKKLKGEIMCRTPAEQCKMHYELSFIKFPELSLEIESGTKLNRKIFFKSSLNGILKKIVYHNFKKLIVFPNWYLSPQTYLGTNREFEQSLVKITEKNINKYKSSMEKLLYYTGCDYKLVENNNGIFFKKGIFLVFNDEIVNLFYFKIPKDDMNIIKKEYIQFEDLNIKESKLLNVFYDLSIMKKIFTNFKEIKVLYSIKNCNLIEIQFKEKIYEFVRYTYKNCIIFQRNDINCIDFFIFKIVDEIIEIYTCSNEKEYEISLEVVKKIKKKLFENSIEIYRSSCIYKLISSWYSKSSKNNLNKNEKIDNIDKKIIGINELEEVFQKAIFTKKNLAKIYEIRINKNKNDILKYLKDDNLRIKLFFLNGNIQNSYNDSKKIKTLLIEEYKIKDKKENKIAKEEIQKQVIYSYCENDNLMDLEIENENMITFQINQQNENESLIFIKSKKEIKNNNLNSFIEMLHLKISHSRFLDKVQFQEYNVINTNFEKEIKVSKGSIYLEFKSSIDDIFNLKIFSCKKRENIFKIKSIVSDQIFILLLPCENDFLNFKLTSKLKKNIINYKIINMNIQNDFYIKGNIRFKPKGKLELLIKGIQTHVIFWELKNNTNIKIYLNNLEISKKISNSGLIRSDNKDYWIIYKNKDNNKKNISIFAGLSFKI